MDNEPNERDKREFDVRCPECRCEFCAADQLVIPRPPGDREAAEKVLRQITHLHLTTKEKWAECNKQAIDILAAALTDARAEEREKAIKEFINSASEVRALRVGIRRLFASDGFTRSDGTRANYEAHEYCEAHESLAALLKGAEGGTERP